MVYLRRRFLAFLLVNFATVIALINTLKLRSQPVPRTTLNAFGKLNEEVLKFLPKPPPVTNIGHLYPRNQKVAIVTFMTKAEKDGYVSMSDYVGFQASPDKSDVTHNLESFGTHYLTFNATVCETSRIRFSS